MSETSGEIPFWEREVTELPPERVKIGIDTCKQIATTIQEKTGITSAVSKILVREGRVPEGYIGVSIFPKKLGLSSSYNQEVKEGVILLPDGFWTEREGIETVAHEETHLILDSSFREIGDGKIRRPVTEGICDLVALEVTDELLGQDKTLQIIEARAAYYQDFRGKQEEVNDYFAKPLESLTSEEVPTNDTPKEIDHIIGRRFVYSLRLANPSINIRDFINCLLLDSPTREELVNPDKYEPKLRSYEPRQTKASPIDIIVTDKPERII